MIIPTQKTYKGRTGYQIVKAATVGKSAAGLGEVWADLPGALLMMTGQDTVVIATAAGPVANVELSVRAARMLRNKLYHANGLMA